VENAAAALVLAREQGKMALAGEIGARLLLYRKNQPFVDE
jgi:hypothetical protein